MSADERTTQPPRDRDDASERVPTRVAFRITCAQCGREDTLPLVPKRMDGYLCRACAANAFGADSRGAEGLVDGFVFACAKCGTETRLPRAPKQAEGLLCPRCMSGEEVPHPERVHGSQVLDRKGGVRRKRRSEG